MELLCNIIGFLFFSWLYLSVISFFFIYITDKNILYDLNKPQPHSYRHRKTQDAIKTGLFIAMILGCFLSLFFILQSGIEKYLVIIPSSWGGYNEDGDWQTVRSSISMILSVALAFWVFSLANNKLMREGREDKERKIAKSDKKE